jgi:hypothetical protein
MPSESIAELPVNDAATNLQAAISRLLAIAAKTALGVLLIAHQVSGSRQI